MEYRGKYNPKIVFPSFSLVVNRYILRRPVRRVPSSRLVWINVPEYRPRPVSVRDQRMTDWAMTTIDRRDEPGAMEDSHAGVLALTPVSELYRRASTSGPANPNTPVLSSVDDDTMSVISSLELGA